MDARFAQYGLAPKTKADYAFLLHELHHLKSDGILTIVLPHGVLFRGKAPKRFDKDGNLLPIEEREEGQAEGQIRANLIEKNNIDAIIGLPANIFFGTGIPTLIMVLKRIVATRVCSSSMPAKVSSRTANRTSSVPQM